MATSPIIMLAVLAVGYIAYTNGIFDKLFSGIFKPGTGGGQTPPGGGSSGPLAPGTPFHFSSAGDFRDNTETATNLAANNPEIVVLNGDYSYSGDAPGWWSGNMAAINDKNVIGALGNHDDNTFKDLWPLNQGQWQFIHKVSNVAFVAVDTEANDPASIDPILQQAQSDPQVAHIIPFMHKTVFTPSPGNDLSPDADAGFHDVFAKYDKIRMVLGGHNHFYARMSAVSGTNFVYVTVGNGGANPHSDSEESGPSQYIKSNGCLHCNVNNQTIDCNMISNEGTTFDTFSISPGSPPQSNQTPAQAGSGDSEADNDADAQATYAKAMMVRAYHTSRFVNSGRFVKIKTRRMR